MPNDLAAQINLPAYPRSAAYDPQWQVDTMMAPNVLWLTESVTSRMHHDPGVPFLEDDIGETLALVEIVARKP